MMQRMPIEKRPQVGLLAEDVLAYGSEVPKVTVPALVLHGTQDETVPIAYSRELFASNPRVELIELADGHQLTASVPRLLAESDRFLEPYLK